MPELLARIKPNARKPGQKRQYTVFGIRFQEERGWYKVDERTATYLRDVKIDDTDPDPDAPRLFEVKTRAEAEEVEKVAARKEGKVLPIDAPVVRPRDVTPGSNVGPRDSNDAPDITTRDLRPTARAPNAQAPNAKAAAKAERKAAAKAAMAAKSTSAAAASTVAEDDGEE